MVINQAANVDFMPILLKGHLSRVQMCVDLCVHVHISMDMYVSSETELVTESSDVFHTSTHGSMHVHVE